MNIAEKITQYVRMYLNYIYLFYLC